MMDVWVNFLFKNIRKEDMRYYMEWEPLKKHDTPVMSPLLCLSGRIKEYCQHLK